MAEYWLFAAIVIGLICIGLACIQARRSDTPMLFFRNTLLIALAPMASFIAVIEFIVLPMFGTESALEMAPFGYFIWIISATLLMRRRSR